MRSLPVVLLLFAVAGGQAACASLGERPTPHLATVEIVDDEDQPRSLASDLGKVVVLDLCAAWSDPCLLSARAVSEACEAICGDEVAMYTVLLDDLGEAAVNAYRGTLRVHQEVTRPGPRLWAGDTALGSPGPIPRLVIFDRDGQIVEDSRGSVFSSTGLIERVNEER